MVAKAFVQVQLPNDPAAALQASTKQYADAKVASITAADSTITMAGTATARTVKVNAIAESQVTNLVTDLAGLVSLSLVGVQGDLLAATGVGAIGRLPVGPDGQILVADSSQSVGIAWADPAATGVASVTAGDSTIVVGGTSSDPTIEVGALGEAQVTNLVTDLAAKVPNSLYTAVGDLLAASDVDTPATVPVGGDGQVLTADSTQTAGVAWADPSGGGAVSTVTAADATVVVDATDPANLIVSVGTIAESQVTDLTTDLGSKVDTSLFAAVGDLIAGGGVDTPATVAVGTDGQVLTADSSQTAGLVWADPAAGGGSVTSVTAADATITVAGTGTDPTIAVGTIVESQVTGLISDLAAKVATSTQVIAGTGLTGGGDLTANRTLTVAYGSTGTTAAVGNDSRLSNARTPTAHASTHATAGTDALAPSDIGAAPTSRLISAGTGLTGGGDLTADRTLTVAYGTSGTTAAAGNDSRLSDSRTPTAHKTTHATGGTDALSPADIGAQPVDTDLTAIAALTATTDNVIQSVSSAWASRTPAQLKATLALAKADVSLGNVDNTSDATKNAAAVTLTNKTLTSPVITTPTGIVASDVGAQPVDSDLTAIAAVAPTNDDILQRKSGAWTNRSIAQLSADLGLAAGYQPLDPDLTAIAGLTATTDNIIMSVGSTWASRTPAQVKTALVLTKSDVGLSAVDNTSNATERAASATLTNKTLTAPVITSPTGIVASDVGAQPVDTDLTTIASLTATTDNMIQSVGSAWASRTPAQVKTALAIAEADVTGLVTDLAGKQPLDTDLTTIANLTATTDNVIMSVGSAWASRTPAQVKTTLAIAEADVSGLVTDLAGKQPLDTDLTTIAGLTATTDNFMVASASAWASRTPTQAKASLAIAEADVSGLVSDLALKAPLASPTFTGVQTAPRVIQTPYTHATTTGTVTIDPTLGNNVNVGVLTGNITLTPSTTGALDGQMLMVQVKADANARTLTITGPTLTTGLASPLALAASKYGFCGFRYSAALATWVLLAYTASL